MKKRIKGNITVFYSLIFTIVLALVCTVTESARMYSAGVKAYSVTNMALESEFAGYSKQLFEEYGVLLLWEQNNIRKEIADYILLNNGTGFAGEGFDILKLNLNSIDLRNVNYATDNGGDEYVKQVIDYTKYAAAGDIAKQLLQYLELYNSGAEGSNQGEYKKDKVNVAELLSEEDIAKLKEVTDRYNNCIKGIKSNSSIYGNFSSGIQSIIESSDSDNDNYNKKEIKNIIKQLKKTKKELKVIENKLGIAVDASNEYCKKKREVLEEHSYIAESEEKDYIEQDSKQLYELERIIKDAVEEINASIKELKSLSSIKKTDFENIYLKLWNESISGIDSQIAGITNIEASAEDEENINIYEEAKQLLETGVLELVLPADKDVSKCAIPSENLCSNDIQESKENVLGNVINKAMFVYYISEKFDNCADENNENVLQYEMEYILHGKKSDKENISDTVAELVLIRQVFNTINVLADKEMMATFSSIATSVSVGLGVPFIEPIVKGILIEACALKDTVKDIKDLLSGEKVPLLDIPDKNADIDIGEMGDITGGNSISEVNDKDAAKETGIDFELGLSYENYLQILLLLHNNEEIVYRSMDLIQANINKKVNSDFRMKECVTSARIDVSYCVPSMFTSVPFVQKVLNSNDLSGEFKISADYGYIN